MKLSVWSSYYYVLSPEDMLREFKKHGFDYCELSSEHSEMLLERGDAKTVGAEFGKFAKEIGIEILQGHLFFWGKKLCDENDRALIKKQIDLFIAIGIKNAVLHCDPIADENGVKAPVNVAREENIKAISDILDHVKGTDMVICLENLITSPAVNNADGLMYFIEHFNSKNLGVCLDTGHLNINDKDQAGFIKRVGKHIKALHLADNEGKTDQHMMPFGKGHVNFKTVISEMKKLGYEGLYNLEIPGESQAPLEVLGYKLDYIKNMMGYLDKITDEQ
ncbi:MAG: sugar phosphate isomerase/epimerase [Clostridia bacterium]|nr:sugar phosphate isomerase/epimerase [Clostridia bacterium]